MSDLQDRLDAFGKWNRRVGKSIQKAPKHFLKRQARPALNRLIARYSTVGDPVVFDNAVFPWTRKFEENFEAIRREAVGLSLLRDQLPGFQEVSPYQKRITSGDQWKTAYLYGFGVRAETMNLLCPVTSRLLDEVPELESACFSMLSPGSHIVAHRGVYKGLINVHLGVIIPKDADKCRMQVGDETVVWREGETRIFDDTNLHEVWNDTGEERVVLFLQVHRALRSPGHQLSRLFLRLLRFSPYLRVPMRNVREFDAQLRALAEHRGVLPVRSH